jgi:hypothetical protein
MNDIHDLPSIIASCNCMTKTNLPEYHKPKCPFRLLTQIELMKKAAAQIYRWSEKNSSIEQLANEIISFKEPTK